jgi:hypothetical protein
VATSAVEEPRVDRIRQILADLVHQRQSLRGAESPETGLLEANRRSIVYWQNQLARALLDERGHPNTGT